MTALSKKFGLTVEFLIFMIGLPLLMYAVLSTATYQITYGGELREFKPVRYLIPIIWALALYCYVIVRVIRHEGMTEDWNRSAVNWTNLKPMLLRFGVAAVVMVVLTWAFKPELLFNFVLEKPAFWLIVMCAYPLLSVIPQEVIYRQFFFMRYQPLFTRAGVMIVMSGLAFGYAHILFHNWVAPTLCLIGGLMFAHTYHKTRSLLLVVIEHALYGDLMFTVGLGRYFYHGSVAAAVQ